MSNSGFYLINTAKLKEKKKKKVGKTEKTTVKLKFDSFFLTPKT